LNYVFGEVVDGFKDSATGGKFCLKLDFTNASKPKAVSKKVLGLIFGGDYDFEAVVFHWLGLAYVGGFHGAVMLSSS